MKISKIYKEIKKIQIPSAWVLKEGNQRRTTSPKQHVGTQRIGRDITHTHNIRLTHYTIVDCERYRQSAAATERHAPCQNFGITGLWISPAPAWSYAKS